jgi:hypothetical protein
MRATHCMNILLYGYYTMEYKQKSRERHLFLASRDLVCCSSEFILLLSGVKPLLQGLFCFADRLFQNRNRAIRLLFVDDQRRRDADGIFTRIQR